MDLFTLEYEINAIVKDLNLAKMRWNRDPDDAWQRIEHALDTAIEAARKLEAGWGDCVYIWCHV